MQVRHEQRPVATKRLFTLATYNIHSCVGVDNRYDVQRVASVIRLLEPDVVGLQEVDRGYWFDSAIGQLEKLAELTGMRLLEGMTLERQSGTYGNALLSRWPLTDVSRLDLGVTGREKRGALGATVEVEKTSVAFVVTHLSRHAGARLQQLKALMDRLDCSADGILAVLGDFNEWRRRGPSIRMLEGALGPTCRPVTYPAWLPLLPLDSIWVRPRHLMQDVRAIREGPARVASDHLPVRARIRLSADPGDGS